MRRAMHQSERSPINSVEHRNTFSFQTPTALDTQCSNSVLFFPLAMERLNNLALLAERDSRLNTDENKSKVSEIDETSDVHIFAKRLLSIAASTVPYTMPSNVDLSSQQNANKFRRYQNTSMSPISLSSSFSSESITPITGATESPGALNQFASLSQAWPAASPTTMTTVQKALAQLALLGISSPPPMKDRNGTYKELAESMNGLASNAKFPRANSNTEQSNARESRQMLSAVQKYQSLDVDQPESFKFSVSKVIIKQTADADEHFFKALNKLQVDVPFQTIAQGRDKNKSPPAPPPYRQRGVVSSTEIRTAAEMAVDEHFEKSLMGFRGFMQPRSLDKHTVKQLPFKNSGFVPTPPTLSQSTSQGVMENTCNKAVRPKTLIRQNAQTDSPTASKQLSPISLSFGQGQKGTFHFTNMENNVTKHGSEQHIFVDHLLENNDTSIDSSKETSKISPAPTTTTANNTFKPKKIWLAQYDCKANLQETTNANSTSSNSGANARCIFSTSLSDINDECEKIEQNYSNDTDQGRNNNRNTQISHKFSSEKMLTISHTGRILDFDKEPNGLPGTERKDSSNSPINFENKFFAWNSSKTIKGIQFTEQYSENRNNEYMNSSSKSLPNDNRSIASSSHMIINGSRTSFISPENGITSKLRSGSAYSLDSSSSHGFPNSSGANDIVRGTEFKKFPSLHTDKPIAIERRQSGEHSLAESTEAAGGFWNMRKRAASEINQNSMMKRSRSVLTSPVLGDDFQDIIEHNHNGSQKHVESDIAVRDSANRITQRPLTPEIPWITRAQTVDCQIATIHPSGKEGLRRKTSEENPTLTSRSVPAEPPKLVRVDCENQHLFHQYSPSSSL